MAHCLQLWWGTMMPGGADRQIEGQASRTSGSCDAFAREHGGARKEALAPCDRAFVVVEKFEIAVAKFEHRDVSRRTNLERPAILEHRESPGGIDRRARDSVGHGHAVAEELRHAIGEIV